jgi:hypothetical protein
MNGALVMKGDVARCHLLAAANGDKEAQAFVAG